MDSENIPKKEDLKQVLWYMMRPSNDSTEDELKIEKNEKAKKTKHISLFEFLT